MKIILLTILGEKAKKEIIDNKTDIRVNFYDSWETHKGSPDRKNLIAAVLMSAWSRNIADFSVPVVKCSIYLSEKSVTEGFLC